MKSLISNLSHQLKTPLANIKMYEEILLEEPDAAARHQFLEKMKKQSEKLEWILNSLFKMVKLEQNVILFEAEMAPIRKTIQEAVSLIYEKAAQKQIQIQMGEIPNLLLSQSEMDSRGVRQFAENAVKYTKEGGLIQIDLHQYEMYAQIQIKDNGMGIRAEEYPLIFQRFYRSKDAGNLEGAVSAFTCQN